MSLRRDEVTGHLVGVEQKPLTPPYQHQEFPKWKYHAVQGSIIVNSADEESALGEGWVNSPAEAKEIADAPAAQAEVAQSEEHSDEPESRDGEV